MNHCGSFHCHCWLLIFWLFNISSDGCLTSQPQLDIYLFIPFCERWRLDNRPRPGNCLDNWASLSSYTHTHTRAYILASPQADSAGVGEGGVGYDRTAKGPQSQGVRLLHFTSFFPWRHTMNFNKDNILLMHSSGLQIMKNIDLELLQVDVTLGLWGNSTRRRADCQDVITRPAAPSSGWKRQHWLNDLLYIDTFCGN